LPDGDEGVALVAQVVDADPAREEAGGGEVAHRAEEAHAVRVLRSGLVRPGELVADGRLLRRGAVDKRRAELPAALAVEPLDAAAYQHLPLRLVDHHEVDELGDARV